MKRDISNICASIYARLQNKARESNRPFSEILQYYGMERFLYRFSRSKYSDKFVLKGALMFMVWQLLERRTTLDIDFLACCDNRVTVIEMLIKNVCNVAVVSDGLRFDSQTVEGHKIKENADYEGVRIKFIGFLGKSRIPMRIDVGFGDVVYPETNKIEYPVILNFPAPCLNGYPPESVISEKFEVMIKLGFLNSRMKDFYDIWLMMRHFEFQGTKLAEAVRKTFEHRKTDIPCGKPLFADEIYDKNWDRQILWTAFLRKDDIKHAPDTLSDMAKEIEKFLLEPVIAIKKGIKFSKK